MNPEVCLSSCAATIARLTNLGVVPFLLDVQFRMPPAIGHCPSGAFYEGRVRSGTKVGGRRCKLDPGLKAPPGFKL